MMEAGKPRLGSRSAGPAGPFVGTLIVRDDFALEALKGPYTALSHLSVHLQLRATCTFTT